MKDGAVFSLETDVGRVGSHRNNGTIESDAEQMFKMLLNLNKIVLVFLKKGVVNGVTKIAISAIGERNKVGKGFDVLFVVVGGDERDESAEEIGNGDNLIALIGSNDARFAARVHRSGDTREIFEAGQQQGLNNDRGASAAAYSDNLWHCLDISRFASVQGEKCGL